MSRDRKIALLNQLQTGKITLEEFRREIKSITSTSTEIQGFLARLTPIELIKIFSIEDKSKKEPGSVSKEEFEFFNSIFDVSEIRESQKTVFSCYYSLVPCELYEVKFKPELNRINQYQLLIGYEPARDVKHHDNILIMEFDLGERFPEVIGVDITKPMFQKICDTLFIENGREPGKLIFKFC